MSTGWIVALALLAAYLAFVFWLVSTRRLERWNLGLLLGVILMVRTQHGKKLIDRIATPTRFWNAFGDFGVVLTLAGMVLMTLLMVLVAGFSLRPDTQPLSASELLVIPGVNPFVPLWYGLIALIVTLVVHEGGHGVLARAAGMRLKSLGLLFLVVPIGAFVEPDEEDLKASPRRKRLRVYAAGAAVNLVLAAVLVGGFAAMVAALEPVEGVPVMGVSRDRPADRAGIEPGAVIVSADGTALGDAAAFSQFMDHRQPGERVSLRLRDGSSHAAVLESRWDSLPDREKQCIIAGEPACLEAYCRPAQGETGLACAQRLPNEAFLGINIFQAKQVQEYLSKPYTLTGFGFAVSLPIGEVRGAPYLSTYLPSFYDAPGGAAFWIALMVVFWIAWINLMVGLTNILPMLPFDGGHLFRDAFGGVVEKLRPGASPEKRDRVVGRTATTLSFVILGLLLLQVFGPRVVQAFA